MSINEKYVCVKCGRDFEEWKTKCPHCNGDVIKVITVERMETSSYDG